MQLIEALRSPLMVGFADKKEIFNQSTNQASDRLLCSLLLHDFAVSDVSSLFHFRFLFRCYVRIL